MHLKICCLSPLTAFHALLCLVVCLIQMAWCSKSQKVHDGLHAGLMGPLLSYMRCNNIKAHNLRQFRA